MRRRRDASREVARRSSSRDVLHAHSPVLNALPALRVGARLGIPVVYEVRAFWEDAAVDHGTTREGSLRYRADARARDLRAAPRRSRHDDLRGAARRHRRARHPAERVTVIPNAVDIDELRVRRARPTPRCARSSGSTARRCIGFIGSFYAYEGLDLLLEALPRCSRRAARRCACCWSAAGRRKRRCKAHGRARCGLADRVVFTGRVPHAEVQRYYELVDVLAYPRYRCA